MSRIEEPRRLLDPASGASADVRRMLAEGRDALEPTAAELARLQSVVASAATGGVLAAGKAGAVKVGGHALTKAGLAKLAAVLVGTSLAVGIGWTELRRGDAPPAPDVAPTSSTAAAANPAPPPQQPAAPVDDGPPAPAAMAAPPLLSVPSVQTRPPPPPVSAAPPPSEPPTPVPGGGVSPTGPLAVPAAPAGESELALLDRARARLAVDPVGAMRVLDEHRARYPGGTFTQEREVLAIEALVRLGRRQEAMARADAFAREFPGSAHRRRIAVLLGEDGGG